MGGGHAHVQVLRRWAMDPPRDLRLRVVLDRPVAVYSGMVPGFVAGDYARHELEIDVVPLARRAGAGVVLAAATDLDPVRREIHLEGRPPIRYDLASLDVGGTVRGLDLPGVREHAVSTRPIARFVSELDRRAGALASLGRPARIVIAGGGAAGVEIAFTLEARLRASGPAPQVTLITADDEFPSGASQRTRQTLAREAAERGILAVLRERVVRVEASGVVTEPAGDTRQTAQDSSGAPRHHPADLVVWATGATPVGFPRHAGVGRLATDEAGFLEVRDTLQAVGFDDVFAVGDCARLVDQRWIPRAGVYAVRQGPILESNLRARLEGGPLRSYRAQRDFLALLNLGDGRALGAKWGHAHSGRLLHRLKDWIDRRFMDRFQVLDVDGRVRRNMAQLGAMGDESETGAAESEAMRCGGCAAKLGALPLGAALAALPAAPPDESVVLGLDARDDVAATRDAHGQTTLHNIDVIRAFCDDPYLTGRVAACNALSDLHAKGGTPRHAQAVIGLPELSPEAAQALLFETLSGLRSILDGQGVSLLGGHTTLGDVLTVGLAVTGEGPGPDQLLRQTGARPGDDLLLCQPLGTGVVLAADMQGLARGDWIQAAHRVMQHPNDVAGRLARELPVHAATDVTGFGLAGHLLSLLDRTGLTAVIESRAIPLLPGAAVLFDQGLRSTAHPANREAFASRVQGADARDEAWLFDPQTAGGLLLAVAPEDREALCLAFAEAGEPEVHHIGQITKPDPAHQRGGPAHAATGRIDVTA